MSTEITALNFDELLRKVDTKEPRNICVVRLTTSVWNDRSGVHIKKTLRYLRRQCQGYNILEEDCSNAGADEAVKNIINLDECKDGVYQVTTCNEFAAWETPHIIEDYDYKLIPYEDSVKKVDNQPLL